ncbi:UDP-glucuronosyl and UDP-glucosyl transferase [Handroanthus impetiginosus]|uniref:Glycosyltransferase n=1 Tax=Handroanthus impetiginosus TaxID=429701 RepID=A0A2G9I9Z2_9LAMI|nr:UDP-glucuronosyl and UDP-glucosyl transferase [Handroanthus impetiginosus]
MASGKENLKVLMFPWLAHGHMSPFLELAKRLSERNFLCYICSTPVNLSSIKKKIAQKYSLRIQLVELNLPSLPELPPQYHTTNGLPLNLHSSLRRALRMAKPEFLNIMKDLQPHLLIHDVLQLWAGSEATLNKIPAVAFFTSGATMVSYFCHLGMRPGIEFPFPSIRLTKSELSMALANMKDARDPDEETSRKIGSIILMNSSREIEGKYMDYLSELINTKIVPIGAFVQYPNIEEESADGDSDIMDWLAKKDKFSSVFVSFGSEYFLKKEEIEEIANGLELSNVNFIWIIRFPKGEEMKVEEALPQGFLERVGERGRIVEKWAPQAKILGHSSIGGFVSHCGWNSLMESIEFGVPIIAMPMHLDQPMNARLVAELGVGVEVKRDDEGWLQRDGISKVVNDVLFGKTGESLRRKVGELRENIRLRSREELEDVILMLEQLGGREKENYTNKLHK